MAETENKASQKDKKRLVKALFSYTPVNIDELQLKVNDILEVIEETEEGWWRGILNGNIGMFPSNFVIELDSLPDEFNNHKMNELSPTKVKNQSKNVDIQDPTTKHDSAHSPAIRHDVVKSSNLSTNSEDVIDTPKVPEPIEKRVPSSKKNIDTAAPRLPPKPVREQARVIYPYTALNEDELSLKEGDIITVISKEIEDKGWWKGELNNRMGVFPDNFVQLIKVEEQKKPERPDKPSKASLRSTSSDKGIPEFSPKIDKKVLKIPPSKPPPPEVHKKEIDRPSPPFPIKKPQVPHPMKKPTRPSLGPKFSGFPTSINAVSSTKHPGVESCSPTPVLTSVVPTTSTKSETIKTTEKPVDTTEEKKTIKLDEKKSSKLEEKKTNKLEEKKTSKPEEKKNNKPEEKKSNKIEEKKTKKDLTFEGLESSGKKLVHLTANRAKVPNRRPPSHIFLREIEKENGISSSDSRRLSEPLLSEMKSIIHLGAIESHKPSAPPAAAIETKAKVPPSRPMPPSIKGNKPTSGSVVLKNTISSEECIVKAPEPIKKTAFPDASVSILVPGPEVIQPNKIDLPSSDFKPLSSDKDLQELKENFRVLMASTVSRNEFNELVKQVRELREGLEKCNSYCKKTINDLRSELELEKNQRLALETELQKIRERQTT